MHADPTALAATAQLTEQAREDAAVALLVARTGHFADCLRERVGSILENDALNVGFGHVAADYERTVDSLAEEAVDLDCRDYAECHPAPAQVASEVGYVVVAIHENSEIGTEVVERYLVGGHDGYTGDEARRNAIEDAEGRTSADVRREGPYSFRAYALVEVR